MTIQSAAVINRVINIVSNRFTAGAERGRSAGDALNGTASWVQGFADKSKLSDTAKTNGFSGKSAGVALGIEKALDELKVGFGYAFPTVTLTLLRVILTRLRTFCLFMANTNPTDFLPTLR